jgi:hypothetical protein
VTQDTYVAAFRKARAEFAQAQKRQAELREELVATDKKLAELRRGLIGLAPLAAESVDDIDFGLTEAVRAALAQATGPLSAKQVVQAIEDLGYDLSGQVNAGASVQAVLARLVDSGEAIRTMRTEKRRSGGTKEITCWIKKPTPTISKAPRPLEVINPVRA